jgi:hypothetical protein
MVAAVLVTVLAPAAHANVVLNVLKQSPVVPSAPGPAAARSFNDDRPAAIVCHRDLARIPRGLQPPQLLRPAAASVRLGCRLTVRGIEVCKNGPGQDQAA